MIISFYNKDFEGLQNNASLVVDRDSYNLIKRPIETNDFSCVCEAFTEDIQPTFVVVKDDYGRYIYGSLAGVPTLSEENKTTINGTDIKTMLSSDVILQYTGDLTTVNDVIEYIFDEWAEQVNQGTISCELKIDIEDIALDKLKPSDDEVGVQVVYNALDEISAYLKAYNLYLDTHLDLVNKKVQFIIGKTMLNKKVVKLWELGIRNYGKWVADVNETRGYYDNGTSLDYNITWVLNSKNQIEAVEKDKTATSRDIYPIKRKVFINGNSLAEANAEALSELLNSMFNEDIEIPAMENVDFATKFEVYLKRGEKYKDLPCGELRYNSSGLKQIQIGYRYTTIDFI